MLTLHPDLQYAVQRLHHETLVAEAGVHRLRRTTQPASRRVLPSLRQLVAHGYQWLCTAVSLQTRSVAAPATLHVTQVYQHLLHTQQQQ